MIEIPLNPAAIRCLLAAACCVDPKHPRQVLRGVYLKYGPEEDQLTCIAASGHVAIKLISLSSHAVPKFKPIIIPVGVIQRFSSEKDFHPGSKLVIYSDNKGIELKINGLSVLDYSIDETLFHEYPDFERLAPKQPAAVENIGFDMKNIAIIKKMNKILGAKKEFIDFTFTGGETAIKFKLFDSSTIYNEGIKMPARRS